MSQAASILCVYVPDLRNWSHKSQNLRENKFCDIHFDQLTQFLSHILCLWFACYHWNQWHLFFNTLKSMNTDIIRNPKKNMNANTFCKRKLQQSLHYKLNALLNGIHYIHSKINITVLSVYLFGGSVLWQILNKCNSWFERVCWGIVCNWSQLYGRRLMLIEFVRDWVRWLSQAW